MTDLHVYDTTLRDGAQQEGLNLSIADKLAIAALLDELGVGFIEGGWPGANPKDTEFFARARQELSLRTATLAAFGATRRPGVMAADDPQVRALLDSGASVVTLVAKAHVRHVELALRTTAAENLAMVRDTVGWLSTQGRRVFLDAEHFFDGYRTDRSYAIEVIRAAMEAGAELVALCDTNGGMLPHQVSDVVADVRDATGLALAFTVTTTPVAQSLTRWPRSRPGRRTSRGRSTATASAPAMPTCSASSATCSSRRGSSCSRPAGWPRPRASPTRSAR